MEMVLMDEWLLKLPIHEWLLKLPPETAEMLNSKASRGGKWLELDETDLVEMSGTVDLAALQAPGDQEPASSPADGGEGKKLCLLLGLVGSALLPHLERLLICGLPVGTTVEAGEQAVKLLLGPAHTRTASLQQLFLSNHECFGTERSCGHLGKLLEAEGCQLDSLYLHNTGMTGAGMGRIAQALQRKTSLKKLEVIACPVKDEGVKQLAENLKLSASGDDNAAAAATALQELCLHDIGMTGKGVGHLCVGPASPAASASGARIRLKGLKISRNHEIGRDGDVDGAKQIGKLLSSHGSLEELDVSYCSLVDKDAHIAKGLGVHPSLKRIDISCNKLGKTGLTLILRNVPSSMEVLLMSDVGEMPDADELVGMLESNCGSLQHLDVSFAKYSTRDWSSVILPAVAQYHKLRVFNISMCLQIDGDRAWAALREILRANTERLNIDLRGTPLYREDVLEDLQFNRELKAVLSQTAPTRVKPPKVCKILMCGEQYSGKSTFFRRIRTTERFSHSNGTGPSRKHLGTGILGIDMHLLNDGEDLRISAWDFGRHIGFPGLRKFIFPSGRTAATLCVFTFNPILNPLKQGMPNAAAIELKTATAFAKELSLCILWIRSIAQIRKPSAIGKLPTVVVVITNKDKVAAKPNGDLERWLTGVADRIRSLEKKFAKSVIIDLSSGPFPFFVAKDDDGPFQACIDHIVRLSGSVLSGFPEEPAICDHPSVVNALSAIGPIISTTVFADICKRHVQDKHVRMLVDRYQKWENVWRAVAAYLHSAGDIIYHEDLDIVVRNAYASKVPVKNAGLLGYDIFGSIIDWYAIGRGAHRQNLNLFARVLPGFPKISARVAVKMPRLQKAVEKRIAGIYHELVDPDELVKLIKGLLDEGWDLGIDLTPGDPNTDYFLPDIFQNDDDEVDDVVDDVVAI